MPASYSYLKNEPRDNYVIVRLERGTANPINKKVVDELSDLLANLSADEANNGMILTGGEGFFSAGVDVLEVYDYDSDQSRSFWSGFIRLHRKMLAFEKPLVAAISGHAPAGGCVLANTADFRIMAEGSFRIGLNETPLGIAVPAEFFHSYAFWIGEREAYHNILEGRLLDTAEALKIGLVDEIATADQLMAGAIAKMEAYQQIIPAVFRQTKRAIRASLLSKIDQDVEDVADAFLKQWWSKESRDALYTLVKKLRNKAS